MSDDKKKSNDHEKKERLIIACIKWSRKRHERSQCWTQVIILRTRCFESVSNAFSWMKREFLYTSLTLKFFFSSKFTIGMFAPINSAFLLWYFAFAQKKRWEMFWKIWKVLSKKQMMFSIESFIITKKKAPHLMRIVCFESRSFPREITYHNADKSIGEISLRIQIMKSIHFFISAG